MSDIHSARTTLLERFDQLDEKRDILKAAELKDLYKVIPTLPGSERREFGQAINQLKLELEAMVEDHEAKQASAALAPIDITAPFDINSRPEQLLPVEQGSIHPLMKESQTISDIFERMGFVTEASREIDDQYHMFESLNFPKNHPARDEYDTFVTSQQDSNGDGFVAPAHTSTMQNRILRKYRANLDKGEPIAAIVPDRVFRNEDVDARHEHTFYQLEGMYVAKGVTVGSLIATLQEFLQTYYGTELKVRANPFYFPFTEPSFEFALSNPFNNSDEDDWIELLGCGLIHPDVLRMADIDPTKYTGFAFGCGIDRLVMMKYDIEDVRHFHSGKLDFLKQFA